MKGMLIGYKSSESSPRKDNKNKEETLNSSVDMALEVK
jgi:hypothetical protein